MKLALQIVLTNLPRHAEEGNQSQILAVSYLQKLICESCNQETAEILVQLIERLFTSCALLDKNHLARNEWRFLSFPAYLFAQSILQTWTDSEHAWFPENFWQPEQPISVLDKQRKILHELETGRLYCHKSTPKPIRFVHVAWAFIKLDGNFVLFHREDKHRPDVPNFVPIGGKLHIYDLKSVAEMDLDKSLNIIQQPINNLIQQALSNTITREIEEETGLKLSIDYDYKELIDLKSYWQVEGAGPKHAFTEYDFKCFHLSLTKRGFFRIHEKILSNNSFTLFNVNEMVNGISSKGETVYLNALYKHFLDDKEHIKEWFAGIPESYIEKYSYSNDELAFDFPYTPDDDFLYGKTGREHRIIHDLNDIEVNWLLTLAWHGKQLEFEDLNETTSLLPHGWIATENLDATLVIQSLSKKLSNVGYDIIEWHGEQCFRLSVKPEIIFFSPKLFDICVSENDKGPEFSIDVTCSSITLPIGRTLKKKVLLKITELIYKNFLAILNGKDVCIYENESLQKQMRRIEGDIRNIGLKKILRIHNGLYKIFTNYA